VVKGTRTAVTGRLATAHFSRRRRPSSTSSQMVAPNRPSRAASLSSGFPTPSPISRRGAQRGESSSTCAA